MLIWDSSYSVKIELIDNQHKLLIEYINQLELAIQDENPKEIIGKILKALVDYTVLHFTTEEVYFKKFKYAEKEEHIEEHQDLIRQVQEFIKIFESDTDFDPDRFMSFLKDWLIDHIMGTDKKYMSCFAENGLI